eukprot:gene2410-2977_t
MATCTVPDAVFEEFKKFKMRRDPPNSAMIFTIDRPNHEFKLAETIDNMTSIEQLQSEISPSAPKYIVYVHKYTHPDGRTSYPLVFIYYMPRGVSPPIAMSYSANKPTLVHKLEIMKCFDAETLETLTSDWLKEKLAFFK